MLPADDRCGRCRTCIRCGALHQPWAATSARRYAGRGVRNSSLHLRGTLSHTGHRVLRVDDRLREVADHPQLDTIVAGGVSSADHMLRIKPLSVALSDTGPEEVSRAVEEYAGAYASYVERNADSMPEGYSGHDPMPRVALVPGVGAITTGQNAADAKVAADIAVHTHGVARTVLDSFGEPEPLSDVETFRFDYWPMELYKRA